MEIISNKSTSSELEDKSLRSVNEPPLQVQLQSSTAEPKEGHYIELQSSTAEPKEGDYTELQSSTAEPKEEHYYIDGLAPIYTTLIPETTNANYCVTKSSIVSNSNAAKDFATREKVYTKQSVWSTPFIVITVLLVIILIVMVAILCMMVAHIASNRTSPDWANGVVSKVNSNVTGSLPDFNEWANGVVSKVNSNVTGSLPDFNEWANGVVSKVNSNVTGSLPDFNEWANGVVSKVNSNVTGSLPDFNEWANGVSQNILQLLQNYPNCNFTELDKQILQSTRDSAQKLINIVNTLSNLQDTSTSTAGVADDILLIVLQRLVLLENDSFTSCKELKSQYPSSPSGYYVLASANGSVDYTAYCNMGTLCGSGGGWTRLAYLDMSDATQNCPSGFKLYQSGGVRACGQPVLGAGCSASVQFPSNGISYSQVCGRVTGYLFGSIDALSTGVVTDADGVTISHGPSQQQIWTLMGGYSELGTSLSSCPCNTGSSISVPSSIGNNYFCESGNPNSSPSQILYTSDPLWDGQGCGSLESPCCNVTGIPWFHRDYGSNTTTDYIELRICGDGSDEDSPVSYYEIYVK